MRWYPHLRLEFINVIGEIYSEQIRDQILGSIQQILKERKLKQEEEKKVYPSVAYKLEAELKKKLDLDIRITIPGHTQRGGSPCPYDRVLSTRMGSAAAGLILKEEYGYMVGIVNGKIKKVPLADCAGKLKMVSPDDQLVKAAKRIGISFGD